MLLAVFSFVVICPLLTLQALYYQAFPSFIFPGQRRYTHSAHGHVDQVYWSFRYRDVSSSALPIPMPSPFRSSPYSVLVARCHHNLDHELKHKNQALDCKLLLALVRVPKQFLGRDKEWPG